MTSSFGVEAQTSLGLSLCHYMNRLLYSLNEHHMIKSMSNSGLILNLRPVFPISNFVNEELVLQSLIHMSIRNEV